MQSAALSMLAVIAFSCGGKVDSDGDAGLWLADGSTVTPHGPPCTQSSCASSVQLISSVSMVEGEQMVPTGLFVGGGFIYTSTPSHLVRAPVTGGPIEIVADSSLTNAILADDQNVYWSTMMNPHIYRMAHAGGAPVAVAPLSGETAEQFFLAGANLYWSDGTSTWSAPIGGGSPAIVGSSPSGGPGVLLDGRMFGFECTSVAEPSSGTVVAGYEMMADSGHCYMLHGTSCGPSWGCGDFVSIPMGGGAPKVLASATSSTGFDLQRTMIDEMGVYLLRDGSPAIDTLIRVPFDGGSVIDVTTDGALAFEVAADTIYWATIANGSVELKSMPKYAP